MNDRNYTSGFYRSIAIAWFIAMGWLFAFHKPWIALSVTLGTITGTGILAGFDWIIRRSFVPGAKAPGRALLKFSLLKYPLFCLALYWLVRWDKVSLPAFCGGIVLVHLAVFIKIIGIRLAERYEER